MKKSIKKILLCGLISSMTLSSSLTALAGTWKQDHIGWWWQEDNGSYPVNTWQWIDGNNDGIAECYYFDNVGYCLLNTTTPDGYTVNADGAWTVNGIVQTKFVAIQNQNNNQGSSDNSNSSSEAPDDWVTPEKEDSENYGTGVSGDGKDETLILDPNAGGDGGELVGGNALNSY